MMKPGKPKSVREIVSTDTYKQEQAGSWKGKNDEHQDQDPMCALGDSVRTVGRLKAVLSVETVVIEDEGHELEVDVSLSTPCHFKRGSQYQFIGELEDRRNSLGNDINSLILVARISRNVDGLDMNLYRRGLKAQEQCLKESAAATNSDNR